MEIGAGSHANCTTELYNPSATHLPSIELSVKNPLPDNGTNEVRNDSNAPNENSEVVTNIISKPAPPKPNNVGKYRLLRTIGKGNFAKVKLAIHMATGVEVAIKIINKTVMDSTLLTRLKREITIMKVTNHPNIVKLLEIIENEDVLCLIMEYASGGEIFDYLVANGKMREKEARIKFRQLLSAIQYCHSKRIVHRDLKAENILLDQNLNVKVADFGLANTFENDQRLTTFCGSPPYAAPELFLGIPYYGPGVDIWSLGVILFTLVIGHLPFDARDLRELRTKILNLHYSIPKGAVTPECESLLRKMLVLDPKERSSLKFLMQDRWVNTGYAPSDYLRPYREPPRAQLDEVRIKAMQAMGFPLADLESSVVTPEFDHVYATYHLLPETPSQFITLYNDLSQTQQTQTAPVTFPNSLMASAGQQPSALPSTAIGRFTVAPSSATESTNTGRTATVEKAPSPLPSQQPGVESNPRDHQSLTSTLPVAFRRALVQMGRTLAGGSADTSLSAGGAPKSPAQAVRPTGKPAPKPVNGTRTVITAAPVPMLPNKKSGLAVATPSKHMSPTLQSTNNSPSSSLRTSVGESSPEAMASHVPKPAGRLSPTVKAPELQALTTIRQQRILNNERESQRQTPLQKKSSPQKSIHKPVPTEQQVMEVIQNRLVDGGRSPTEKEGHYIPPNLQVHPQPTHSPQGHDSQATAPTDMTDTTQFRPVNRIPSNDSSSCSSSSNTSGSSGMEREVRQTAATLVQNICHFTESYRHNSPCSSSASSSQPVASTASTPPSPYQLTTPAASPVQSTNYGVPLGIHRGSAASDGAKGIPSPPFLSQKDATVPHTVQGLEAKAMRDGALRLQPGREPVALSSSKNPASYCTVDTHTNTWSRSVRKALGGLFTQPKSQEQHHVIMNTFLVKPREVRFPWSVHTTSTKPANEVLQNIVHALETTPGCRYIHDPHLPFMLRCSWASSRAALKPLPTTTDTLTAEISPQPSASITTDDVTASVTAGPGGLLSDDPVHWEMEVCQLPRLHLRGVRLKRIRGSTLHFKPIADMIMRTLKL